MDSRTLQPGLIVRLELDPRRSVRALRDRRATRTARCMDVHAVAALVNAVHSDWVQVMLVGRYDPRLKPKDQPEPCVALPFDAPLAVYPLQRYDFRVAALHPRDTAARPTAVLEDVLIDARLQNLAVALHGPRCRLTADERWKLEDVASRMYEDLDADDDDATRAEDEGVVPYVRVWADFELADCGEPALLRDDLQLLDEIEIRKAERDEESESRRRAREIKAALLRSQPREDDVPPSEPLDPSRPLPGETAKKYLRRTFVQTKLPAIENSDDDGSASERVPEALVPPRRTSRFATHVLHCARWVKGAVGIVW